MKIPQRRINEIVKALIAADATLCMKQAAIEFAKAQLTYQRVLRVRKRILKERRRELKLEYGSTANAVLATDPALATLDRYERRALKRRMKAAQRLSLLLAHAEGEVLAEQSHSNVHLSSCSTNTIAAIWTSDAVSI